MGRCGWGCDLKSAEKSRQNRCILIFSQPLKIGVKIKRELQNSDIGFTPKSPSLRGRLNVAQGDAGALGNPVFTGSPERSGGRLISMLISRPPLRSGLYFKY